MGCISLYFVFTQQFQVVGWLILAAALADVFDGQVARWLGADSNLGKQLDSLADVVSFGVVPGTILFQLIRFAYDAEHSMNVGSMGLILSFFGFIFTLGAALRLAKFNIDTRQITGFIGLATPGATVVVIGLMLIHIQGDGVWYGLIMNPYFLIGMTFLLFALMLSPIPMFSLQTLSSGWASNKIPILFILLSIPSMILFRGPALVLLPMLYVILSFFIHRPT